MYIIYCRCKKYEVIYPNITEKSIYVNYPKEGDTFIDDSSLFGRIL